METEFFKNPAESRPRPPASVVLTLWGLLLLWLLLLGLLGLLGLVARLGVCWRVPSLVIHLEMQTVNNIISSYWVCDYTCAPGMVAGTMEMGWFP